MHKPGALARFVNYKQPTAIKTDRLYPQLPIVHIHDTEYSSLTLSRLPSELSSSNTSKIYPPLKPVRKQSTSLSKLLDASSELNPQSQDTISSLFIPEQRYILRTLHSRRLSTDTATLDFSALSSKSALRLARQHAQPISSDTSTNCISFRKSIL